MANVKWDDSAFQAECVKVTMDLLEQAAWKIVRDAKNKLTSYGNKGFHRPPYKTGDAAGQPWTARQQGAMVKTIRAVRKRGDDRRNIWIMAGNKETWWAIQLEYGRGAWKGGRKSFMRPAMANAPRHIRDVLESGGGQTS